jgi:carboxypeptidase PM20D1
VPICPQKWSFDQGQVVIDNRFGGRIYGRGTLDMKSMIIQQIFAVKKFLCLKKKLGYNLYLIVNSDEETGGTHADAIVSRHWNKFINPVCCIDEGSYGVQDIIHNKVLFPISIAEKDQYIVRIFIRDHSGGGHTALPKLKQEPDCLYEGSRIWAHLQKIKGKFSLHPIILNMLKKIGEGESGVYAFILNNADNFFCKKIIQREYSKTRMQYATTHNTFVFPVVNTTSSYSFIPECISIVGDIRSFPGAFTREELVKFLYSYIGKIQRRVELDISIIKEFKSNISSVQTKFYSILNDAITKNVANSVCAEYLTLGGTDGRFFRKNGVNVYGLCPISLSKSELNLLHGIDEYISFENLLLGANIYFDFLKKLS